MTKQTIDRLAEQAKNSVPRGILAPDQWIQSYNQIYAKLIIEECISACATDRLGRTVGAEELIKQHFGIKD